ncbi:Uncharacterized protein HZ326_10400 [Fusarium oxysporum f. sp. albedinis]|nr:Uncharacterized protein HZ326_10400 [Fusarium oxysporum f. sp. albedinis]
MLGVPSRSVVERGMMGGTLRRGGDIARRVKRRMIEDEGDCERVALEPRLEESHQTPDFTSYGTTQRAAIRQNHQNLSE